MFHDTALVISCDSISLIFSSILVTILCSLFSFVCCKFASSATSTGRAVSKAVLASCNLALSAGRESGSLSFNSNATSRSTLACAAASSWIRSCSILPASWSSSMRASISLRSSFRSSFSLLDIFSCKAFCVPSSAINVFVYNTRVRVVVAVVSGS